MDSHADTCDFGNDCCVLYTYQSNIQVSGFHSSLETISNVVEALIAVAYDCPLTLHTYILLFDHSLFIPNMKTHLLNPDQMREQGVIVNDIPLRRLPPSQRHHKAHLILIPDQDFHIPFLYDQPLSYFNIRKPSLEEVHDHVNITQCRMTSELGWEPYCYSANMEEEQLRIEVTPKLHGYMSLSSVQNVSQLAISYNSD